MGEENVTESWRRVMSPEIVEIGDDSKSTIIASRDDGAGDVFVAVGKNDLDVVKWAIDHAVSPGARVYLIHVFPTVTYVPTPVGRLSRSQLSKEQAQIFVTEENNRRRNLLQKYIRLCTNAKVAVDTMLLESNDTAKAILDLIPVLNITNLVMGIKRPPNSFRLPCRLTDLSSRNCSMFLPWRLRTGAGKGEFVRKNAPDFCEVTIVQDGKKVTNTQPRLVAGDAPSARSCSETAPQSERKFFECTCFSGKFD